MKGVSRFVHWRLIPLGAAAALAMVVGGCSSTPIKPATISTNPASSSSSTSTTNEATTVPSTSITTTSAAVTSTTAQCATTGVKFSPASTGGAAGTMTASVTISATSMSPCTVNGYPDLRLLGTGGTGLPTHVIDGGGPLYPDAAANGSPGPVKLSGGAAFSLSYEDVPVGNETSCPSSVSLSISLPGGVGPIAIPFAIAPCGGGTIHVSPIYSTS